jgi:hypothetical protein
MSSISIEAAKSTYGGKTDRETLLNMARATGCTRIYMYRNAYQKWWSRGRTDYLRVENPGDEDRLISSGYVQKPVLVYDHGTIHIPITRILYAPLGKVAGFVTKPFFTLFGAPNVQKLKDKRDIRGLIKALNYRKPGKYHIPAEAIEALGEFGDPSAVEPLIKILHNEKYTVKEILGRDAALALGKIRDVRALEPLILALNDKSLRTAAIVALGDLGDSCAVSPLTLILQDKDKGDKETVIEALAKIGDEPAVEALISVLKDEKKYDWRLQECAANALVEIGDARALKPLGEALKFSQRNALKEKLKDKVS